jgi:hypothetical protein
MGGTLPVTLDELQRKPDLLRAVKRTIDRRRPPGRFLLIGSANLLLMRQSSESHTGCARGLVYFEVSRGLARDLDVPSRFLMPADHRALWLAVRG